MARKRASLKDKGAETLGLTQKKGKGIDVLFGGPSENEAEESAPLEPAATQEAVDTSNDLSKLIDNLPAAQEAPPSPSAFNPQPAAPLPDSLPVNEADDDEADVITSQDMTDDLGLPVAMDAPPADLELATPPAEPSMPETPAAAETSPAPLSPDSLPAAETPPTDLPPAAPLPAAAEMSVDEADDGDDEELWGLDSVDDFADIEPDTPAATEVPPAEEDDLSGLEADDELAGLADDATAPPAVSDTPAPTETTAANEPTTIPPSNLPPGMPSASAAPTSTPRPMPSVPSVSNAPQDTGPASDTQPQPSNTARPTPGSTMSRPPSTATGAPSMSMPRARIESVGGFVSEPIEVKEEDIIPEDTKMLEANHILDLKEREKVDYDEEMTRKVTRYIGSERREKLDQEIEDLYNEVARELSVNKDDSEFALKVLSQAQDIIFEDTRQYDEALYLVAIVRTMIERKRNLRKWSYTWGTFVFLYAIIWLAAFLAGFLLDSQISEFIGESSANVMAVRAAWFSALAGGIGGMIGILYSLYWHVAMKQDFDRQYVMYYLVQPVMGFVLGAVVYFIIGSGFLLVNLAIDGDSNNVLNSSTVIAIQIVFGWIAGFRQRFVFEMIDKIVQRVSPQPEGDDTKKPESLIPDEQRERIQVRIEEKARAIPTPDAAASTADSKKT